MVDKQNYWSKEGAAKTFTHGIHADWIDMPDKNTGVLDFGCGYGRLTPGLIRLGFDNITAYDPSAALIQRARVENPGASYTDRFADCQHQGFGLVLCFAVFTCCPSDLEQQAIVSQIDSVSRQGTLLYLSDYLMQDNPHYQARYEQCYGGIRGCFSSGNGHFRHHDNGHFEQLLAHWTLTDERSEAGKTMNGNDIVIHQYRFARD